MSTEYDSDDEKNSSYLECSVCVSEKRYGIVSCPYCAYVVCETCIFKYLTTFRCTEPNCMNCKKTWTPKFFYQQMSNRYIEDYRNYQIKILMDREKSMLVETQPFVEEKIKQEKNKEKAREILEKIKVLKKQIDDYRAEIRLLYDIDDNEKEEEKQRIFIGHCPQPDCKGFLNHRFKCGICENRACKVCKQIRHKGSECKKEDIETAELLSQGTKPCPKCKIPIFRSVGCDHMFCTMCHTSFNWETGQITKTMANPHYYEMMRRGGIQRNNLDVPCGGIDLLAFTKSIEFLQNRKLYERIQGFVQHIRETVMPKFAQRDLIEKYRDMRVNYLLNRLKEEDWFADLKRREKKQQKDQEIYSILEAFCVSIESILSNIITIRERSSRINEDQIIKELEAVRKYTGEAQYDVAKRYKSKVHDYSKGTWKQLFRSLNWNV